MRAQEIKQLIETQLEQCVTHMGNDDGRHFNALVLSPIFAGKNRIERQQLVYAALGEHIKDGTIHAISIKALTFEEWTEKQKSTHHG